MSDRNEILAKVDSVPALPMAATKVIQMIREPDVGVADVMGVVEYDPGLTSNVLRLANSAYFGGNREIVSLRDAGVRLGLNRVFQLVMTSAISKVVSQPIHGYSLSPGELLEHSMAVAIGAEQLACALDRQPPPETFTTGLLHDLGKIVLGTFVEIDVTPILQVAFQEQVSFEIAEQRVLGIDHAEVGGVLLESWDIPSSIVAGVRMHHKPLDIDGDSLVVSLVHVADSLCLETGIGMGIDGLNYQSLPEVSEQLHLTPQVCETVVCKMLTELDELREVFDIAVRS